MDTRRWLCRTADEAQQALAEVREWMAEAGLTLHPSPWHKEPSKRSLSRFRDRVREVTPRKGGKALTAVIAPLNRMLRGWFQYFQHIKRWKLVALDG